MAPEQATADPATDHRADIYAFGVLAYELLTGQPPFAGRSPSALLAAQVTETPEPVGRRRPAIPPALASLIMRCLEKRPADRPQAASEIVHALDELVTPSGGTQPTSARVPAVSADQQPRAGGRSLTRIGIGAVAAIVVALGAWQLVPRMTRGTSLATPATPATHKIAVLPFEPLRGDTANAYLGDGMATDLTAALGGLEQFTVVPRSSAFALRGSTAKQAGDKLQASNVVEGTIGRVGSRLRVTVSLVNVANETVRWSHKYDEDERNIFQLHDSIASAIASALDAGASASAGRSLKPPTRNIEAHDLVQRAAFLNNQKAQEASLREAITLSERAIALDSSYADAWIALAESWFHLADRYVAPLEAIPHMRSAATRAVAADPRSAEAMGMLGNVVSAYDHDYPEAEREFRRALALDSANAEASSGYAWQLWSLGQADSALAAVSRALRQNPLSALVLSPGVTIAPAAGKMDVAREYCRRYTELGASGDGCEAKLLVAEHRYREAVAVWRRLLAGEGATTRQRCGLVQALALAGDTVAARRELAVVEAEARTRYVDGFWVAIAYAALGDRQRALDWVERMVADHSANAMTIKADPNLASLRGDPRFEALARRAGL